MGASYPKRILLSTLVTMAFLLALLAGCSEKVPEKPVSQTPAPAAPPAPAKTTQGAKVLLVHSYHAEYPWVDEITKGVKAGLEGTGAQLEVFYMDTKRKTDDQWKVRSGELASEKMAEYKPDAVITADDNAQQYFAMKYVDGKTPFVFCGVNADPAKYGFPASNVTGIIERPHFKQTLEYAGSLFPIHKVAVLSSDDETSIAALGFMKAEYLDVEVTEWTLISDFNKWKDAILSCNGSVDAICIYMYHTVKEPGNPTSLEPKVVAGWTVDNATVPVLAFFDFGVEDGMLAGIVESGFEHGEKAARYAVEMIKGTPVSSLPVVKANVGTRMVNLKTAAKLGITIPPEALKDARVIKGD